jgi:hypothetical protein
VIFYITETSCPKGVFLSLWIPISFLGLDIQAVTLEYLDEAGKPIGFKSGEKIAKVYPFWRALKPEEVIQGSLDTTIPRAVVKEKVLGKIEINVVYVPSPLKRETLTLPEKIE